MDEPAERILRTLERILVGDDQIEYVKSVFPAIPGAAVDFVDSAKAVIEKARAGMVVENVRLGTYNLIVTDLQYTPNGEEGFDVLRALRDHPARKILWTGAAYEPSVRKQAKELGAEVLDKPEIGSLVGAVVSKALFKKGGKVLIYVNSPTLQKAYEQVVGVFFPQSDVNVGSNLARELKTGEYGLVIDTTTTLRKGPGAVAHDMKYLQLFEVPRVVELRNPGQELADICRVIGRYRKLTEK